MTNPPLQLVPKPEALRNVGEFLIALLVQARAKGADQATAALAWEEVIRKKLDEVAPPTPDRAAA